MIFEFFNLLLHMKKFFQKFTNNFWVSIINNDVDMQHFVCISLRIYKILVIYIDIRYKFIFFFNYFNQFK